MTPIKMVIHREILGTPKNVTISKAPSGKYYASIVAELDIPHAPLNGEQCGGRVPRHKATANPKGDKIGLDLGIKQFAIASSGEKFENPKYFQKS